MPVITFQRGDTTALTKNFTRKEFQCPCGCARQSVDTELAEKLQTIRDKVGRELKVTSGYRCLTHNASKSVGGSPSSKHCYGMAADWRTMNRSINPVALGILAQAAGFGGIGIYWYDGNAFCHADTRNAKATWLLQRYLYDDVSFDGSLYESSSIHSYMNNTFFPKIDASMQSLVKSVKIPFRDNKGANGLSTRAFALAACEIGQSISDDDSGAVLKYFSNGNSPVARNTSGTSLNWWTRSRYKGWFGSNDNWYVDTSGDITRGSSGRSEKVRPCVIVPSTALLDDSGNFIT